MFGINPRPKPGVFSYVEIAEKTFVHRCSRLIALNPYLYQQVIPRYAHLLHISPTGTYTFIVRVNRQCQCSPPEYGYEHRGVSITGRK